MSKPICPKCGSEKICCIWEETITSEVKELIIDKDGGLVNIVPGKTTNTERSSYPIAQCDNCNWSS